MSKSTSTKDKDPKKGLMICLIILVSVAICILIAILVILLVKNSEGPDKKDILPANISDEKHDYNPHEDARIRDTASLLMSNITEYQTNNNGRLPDTDSWDYFLDSYMDSTDYGYGYSFIECDDLEDGGCVKPKELNWKDNKKELYVVTRAECASNGKGIVSNNLPRSYALYTVLSNGNLYCADNR